MLVALTSAAVVTSRPVHVVLAPPAKLDAAQEMGFTRESVTDRAEIDTLPELVTVYVSVIACPTPENDTGVEATERDRRGVPSMEIDADAALFDMLGSLLAPVVTLTDAVPAVLGVPETGQVIEEPGRSVAGGAGEQVPSVRPTGKPLTLHVALCAEAFAFAEFVHRIDPL